MGIEKESGIGIPRSLFGYRPAAVRDLLLESEWGHRRAESDILAAEARIGELQAALATMEEEIARRDQRLRALQAEVARLEDRSADGRPLFVTAEVSSILASAQDAASRILDRARSVSERILEESRCDDHLHADVVRLTAWRDEALPVIRSVRESVEGLRRGLDGVTQRIEEALSSLERLPEIDDVLGPAWTENDERDGNVLDGARIIERRSPVYQLIG
jgi:chromosome segregation ATPase